MKLSEVHNQQSRTQVAVDNASNDNVQAQASLTNAKQAQTNGVSAKQTVEAELATLNTTLGQQQQALATAKTSLANAQIKLQSSKTNA